MRLNLSASQSFARKRTFTSSLTSIWCPPPRLTAQVIPQSGGIVAGVAGIVVDGLVARSLVGDDKISRLDRHRTDEDGQQGYGDHQQDDEGGAGVDVGAHQTHKQTQEQDD